MCFQKACTRTPLIVVEIQKGSQFLIHQQNLVAAEVLIVGIVQLLIIQESAGIGSDRDIPPHAQANTTLIYSRADKIVVDIRAQHPLQSFSITHTQGWIRRLQVLLTRWVGGITIGEVVAGCKGYLR